MKELEIIEQIRKKAGKPGGDVIAGIGDDCAVLKYSKEKYLLWSTDMLVEGTHFIVPDAGYKKIGRKAVAVNISDIASMGGIPRFITVSIGAPGPFRSRGFKSLYNGIEEVCEEFGVKLVGGDINRSEKLVIDISIIGTVEKNRLTKRSGARAGDKILITGPVRDGRKDHFGFIPRVKEARYLTSRYRITSMIDVSDGISLDIGRICDASDVGCSIYSGHIPLSRGLSLEDALYYGESFELMFTMSARECDKLLSGKRGKHGFYVIGDILRRKKGRRLTGENGKVSVLEGRGFSHLS